MAPSDGQASAAAQRCSDAPQSALCLVRHGLDAGLADQTHHGLRVQKADHDTARHFLTIMTDNVALLPMLAGRPNAEARQRVRELLAALDVGHRALAQPSELSGGEQQRVSIARALANRPPVILADEPTAPLDSERALAVMGILNQMALQYHTAIIVVTHGEKIIPTFKRLYQIRDGSTHEETGEGRSL